MAAWFKRSLIILVSILTFGLVTPNDFAWLADADTLKDSKKGVVEDDHLSYLSSDPTHSEFDRKQFITEILDKAEKNAYEKFGTKIEPKIGLEFKTEILPKIEETILTMATQFPDEDLQNLMVTEQPGGGRSERIFHIYDSESGKDLIRFHVRQDNPPLEGHWFNFHYHTYQDSYITHYDLGSIYWDKNTPPEWSNGQRAAKSPIH